MVETSRRWAEDGPRIWHCATRPDASPSARARYRGRTSLALAYGPFGYSGSQGARASIQNYAAPDGTETVLAYHCAENCPVAALDGQAGERPPGYRHNASTQSGSAFHNNAGVGERGYLDQGGMSRFFFQADWALEVAEQLAQADPVRYEAKASQAERSAGLAQRNPHCTVKPIALAKWLCSLLLPPAAYAPRRILVPFAGAGSEGIGALLAGWEEIVMIEQAAEYCEIAAKRLEWWRTQDQPSLWPGMTLEAKKPVAPTQTETTLPLFVLE